jgi:hypothetical protein
VASENVSAIFFSMVVLLTLKPDGFC